MGDAAILVARIYGPGGPFAANIGGPDASEFLAHALENALPETGHWGTVVIAGEADSETVRRLQGVIDGTQRRIGEGGKFVALRPQQVTPRVLAEVLPRGTPYRPFAAITVLRLATFLLLGLSLSGLFLHARLAETAT